MLVAVGDNCIDRYLPPIGLQRVGGNAVNVAANLATHGHPAAYVGVVGDDEDGKLVLGALRAIDVNVEWVSHASGPTGITEIQVQGGDYAILREDYGVSNQVHITDALVTFLSAQGTRIHLTVSGRATALIQELPTVPLPISVDLGIVRREADLDPFESLLTRVSEAFFSAGGGLDDAVVDKILEKAAALGARTAIATRGGRGCTAYHDGKLLTAASQISPGDIVDPLGAGDAFIAGYLSTRQGDTQGARAVEQGLVTASTWAAQACRIIGGWPGAGP